MTEASPTPLLSVIILTRDEAPNLPHALASLQPLGASVLIVDSGSRDETVAIAEAAGCTVFCNPWVNYATQLNWAIDHLPFDTPWVMRLDADERLTPELVHELQRRLPELSEDVTGVIVKRQVWFWGRWIRHGGWYPMWVLRVWRRGTARCEQRWMDEHMQLEGGRAVRFDHDLIDENHKGLTFWTNKHNSYSDRELRDIADGLMLDTAVHLDDQARKKRLAKEKLYYRSPPYLRAFGYWFIRYFIRLGFLDGREGLVYHFLQALWYRFLIDAKLEEARRAQAAARSSTASSDAPKTSQLSRRS